MKQNIFLCQVINKNGLQEDLNRNGYGLYKSELIWTSEAAYNTFNIQKCEYMLVRSPDILLFLFSVYEKCRYISVKSHYGISEVSWSIFTTLLSIQD